jgi:hypothetical protein
MEIVAEDSKQIVDATKVPYTVPVDVVVRTFQFLLFAMVAFVAYTNVRTPEDVSVTTWVLLILMLAYTGFLLFRPSGLSIDAEGIHHAPWIRRKRDLPWEAIESVTTGTQDFHFRGGPTFKGPLGNVDASLGPYLMVIERRDGQRPFVLNIKPYSMRGIITLSHFLICKTSQARIDEQTVKLTKGIVPSVWFGEQKGHL